MPKEARHGLLQRCENVHGYACGTREDAREQFIEDLLILKTARDFWVTEPHTQQYDDAVLALVNIAISEGEQAL